MRLTVSSVDEAPPELAERVPFAVDLLREIPGPDRTDYWLGALVRPLRRTRRSRDVEVTHLVLATRWTGTRIGPGVRRLPVAIAYVTDESLLEDGRLEFSKTEYVAVGIAEDTIGRLRM